jgi:hypothetical protein
MPVFRHVLVALATVVAVSGVAAEAAPAAPPPFQVADADGFASQKAEYETRARQEMKLWQQRMTEAGDKANEKLDRAWTQTKEQWAVLQRTTADGWARSREAFERASERMKETWNNYRSNDQ